MRNTTGVFLLGALCILLNQNVIAQDNVKKSTEEGGKVMVKQEYTIKKMEKVEPKITTQPTQSKQNLAKSTSLSKSTTVNHPDDIPTVQQQVQKLKSLLEDATLRPQQYSVAQIEKLKEALNQKEVLLNQLLHPVKK